MIHKLYLNSILFASILYFSSITLLFAIPVNDDLVAAINVAAVPYSDTVALADTDTATNEVGELLCDSGFYNATWWYSYTTAVAGTITANSLTDNGLVIGNDTAVNIAIYSGVAHPLTEEDCQSSFTDNTLNPSASAVVGPGTYFIAVGNPASTPSSDAITVNINFTVAPAVVAVTKSIPTLSGWVLLFLSLILGFFAAIKMRSHQSENLLFK